MNLNILSKRNNFLKCLVGILEFYVSVCYSGLTCIDNLNTFQLLNLERPESILFCSAIIH